MLKGIAFQNSPGILSGLFFFIVTCISTHVGASTSETSSRLAVELFNEANWSGARQEARRALSAEPGSETARSVNAAAALRIAPTNTPALEELQNLATNSASLEIRAFALSENGFALWATGKRDKALAALTLAFRQGGSPEVKARSSFGACILLSKIKTQPDIDSFWRTNLADYVSTWTAEIRNAGAIRISPEAKRSLSSLPGELITNFYRSQISPTLGSRCVLEPSCSEYFLQASSKCGWLGFPMIGDRLIREPSVSNAKEKPVTVNRQTRYADPLGDHVFATGKKE